MKGVLLFCCFLLSAQVFSQSKLYPINETESDDDISTFVQTLRQIIARKDTASFHALLDREVISSFGGDNNIASFREYWTAFGMEKLWSTLSELLNLGCTLNRDAESGKVNGATWPYTFTEFPSDLDAYETMVVIGKNVAFREKPELDSKVLVRLTYDILTWDYEATDSLKDKRTENWENLRWYVVNHNGGRGYVAAEFLRSPIDYRMSIAKLDGEWKIVYLVAGD